MKTYMKILVALGIGALLFSGCASSGQSVKVGTPSAKEFKVSKSDKNVYTFRSLKRGYKYAKGVEGDQILIKKGLIAAMDYGRSQGYRYMAIVNSGINNLSGFPLNTVDTIVDYAGLAGKGHFKPKTYNRRDSNTLLNDHKLNLKVVYFKEKLPGIFLFRL